jgi:hypothetical protein
MLYRSTLRSDSITLPELGKTRQTCLECDIEWEHEPEVSRSWDYPGDPECGHIRRVEVTRIVTDECEYTRAERPDWFTMLDRLAMDRLSGENICKWVS